MSEKQFVLYEHKGNYYILQNPRLHLDFIEMLGDALTDEEIVDKLNEQESTITSLKERNKQLRRRLEKINGGYGHLTHRNGLTANEWVIESQEKELRKKNEQISDWIERHSKDIVKIGEQQATIRKLQDLCGKSDGENAKLRIENKRLQEENEQLRQQLKEKEEDEQLYANEIVKLNKEAKEVLDFKSLGGNY